MKFTNKISILLAVGILWVQPLSLRGQAIAAEPSPDQTLPNDRAGENTNALTASTNVVVVPSENYSPQKRRGPVVSIGGSAILVAGESAEVVVAIGGSAKAGGRVQDAVVAIGGDAEADLDVGDAVVAIGGNATARGKVGDAVVAIAGNAGAHGEVGDTVVAIMGDVKIGPGGIIRGDVVSIGGKVEVAEGAQIKGKIVEIGVAQYPILAPLYGVADWFRHCLLKFRLLAPQAGWYWAVAGGFLLFYLLIAVAIPRPIAACVNEITQRPATTFLLGLLAKLLVPLVLIVLVMTGIGVLVVPFVLAAVFIGAMIGKVALFEYLGGKIFGTFGIAVAQPVLALLAGFVLITLFYLVPVLSLLVYFLFGLWALGVAVTAAFSGARKESSPRPRSAPPEATPTGPLSPGSVGMASAPGAGFTASTATDAPGAPAASIPPSPPVAPHGGEALALPRANFWERMGAAFLDVILVILLSALVGGLPLGFLVALAYFAGMWTWKGTTIGGIVLNLKVVRLDDHPVTFAVALVRGLASALSAIVLLLGFFWMIWDPEKQTWHDKIAGTVVVRSPRGMPLVCL
jgi:uncharacterized RDD family membrane protein YckC